MLTGTMVATELQKIYNCDKERIFRFLERKEPELRRQLKKGFARKCSKCYDYNTKNAEYKLSICVYSRRSFIYVYMYIYETNEYVLVTAMTNKDDYACIVFTPHYIRRMGQRIYGDKEMGINKILAYFILHSNTSINIYHHERNYVFATQGGISLAIYDDKRDLMVLKTFISVEMLKSTQIEAWNRVASLVEDFDRFVEEKSVRNGNTNEYILHQLSFEISKLDLDEISNIYGEYFNKKK